MRDMLGYVVRGDRGASYSPIGWHVEIDARDLDVRVELGHGDDPGSFNATA